MAEAKITKKKMQALRTRQLLLETACQCFAQNGYPNCSLDMIAQAAGITKGAIYTHFDSKAELFVAIIEYAYARALLRTNELRRSQPLADALIAVLGECYRNQEFPIDHRLWAQVLAVANREAAVRSVFLRSTGDFEATLEKWIDEGIKTGEIAPAAHAKSVVDVIVLIGNGLVVRLGEDGSDSLDEAFGILETTLRNFLKPRSKS